MFKLRVMKYLRKFISNVNELSYISLILVLSALIYTVYVLNSRTDINPQRSRAAGPTPTSIFQPTAPQTSYLTTARNILDWMDTQKDTRGVYQNGECRENQGCDDPVEDPKVAHFVLWSRYQAYKSGRFPDQLNQLSRDLASFNSLYQIPDYHISYLNNLPVCSLLYPIATDEEVPSSDRSILEELCRNSMFVGKVITQADNLINQTGTIAEPEVDKVIQDIPLPADPETDTVNYNRGFRQYAVYASDLITQYRWFDDNKQFQRAKHNFNKALEVYSREKDGDMLKYEGDAILSLAASDLYTATQNRKYENFITKYITRKTLSGCYTTTDCSYYLLMLFKMFQATGNQQYRQALTETIDSLMTKAYDPKVGAFHEMIPGIKIFDVRTNSILSGILA